MSRTGAYPHHVQLAGGPLQEEWQQTAATRAQFPTTIQIPECSTEEYSQKERPASKKRSRRHDELKIRVDPRSHDATKALKSPTSPTRERLAIQTERNAAKPAPRTPRTHRTPHQPGLANGQQVCQSQNSVQGGMEHGHYNSAQSPSYTPFAGSPQQDESTPEGSMLFTPALAHSSQPTPMEDVQTPRPTRHGALPGFPWADPKAGYHYTPQDGHPYLSPPAMSPDYPSAPSPTPSATSTSSYSSSSTSSSGYSHLGFPRISSPWSPTPGSPLSLQPSTPQALKVLPLEHDSFPTYDSGMLGPMSGVRIQQSTGTERPKYDNVKFQVKGGSEPGVRIDKVVGALYDPVLENADTKPFSTFRSINVHYVWPGYEPHIKRVSTLNKAITAQQLMLVLCTEFHKWATSKAVKCTKHQHPGYALGTEVDPMNVFVTELVHLGGTDWRLELWTPTLHRR